MALRPRGRVQRVRETPSWPRSWATFGLLWLCSHRNARASLRLSGRPETLLVPKVGAWKMGISVLEVTTPAPVLQQAGDILTELRLFKHEKVILY